MNLQERKWTGVWISDKTYHVESPASPVPMMFRRRFYLPDHIVSLQIHATAMGIFDLYLDEKRINEDYFSPGFTDYSAQLQYVSFVLNDISAGDHEFKAVVAGGWAIGRTTHVDDTNKSKSKLSADRQALLCDLVLTDENGHTETIGTDAQFEVTEDGPWRFGDFYDGETFDARIKEQDILWHPATQETLRISPRIYSRYGCAVTAHERFDPVSWQTSPSGELIVDFGQNMAGIIELSILGKEGKTNGQLYLPGRRPNLFSPFHLYGVSLCWHPRRNAKGYKDFRRFTLLQF